ncbi:hypothetical protein BJ944DRAFT_270172 [Cunninghamella echinulata]|nr:hypothetical protein BJ944DRAFT_270172 [Cunninghamella echinulata]
MSLSRIIKNKGILFTITFICTALFFLSSLIPSSTKNSTSSLYKDKSSTTTATKDIHVKSQHSRLTDERLLLLYSALGHMKIGYVTNRTPDIDTPPLTIMYSCKSSLMGCGSFGTRLMNIIQSYYFAMLIEGTAYTTDMSYPVDFNAYFESKPGYMALLPQQIYKYINELQSKDRQLLNNTMQTMELVSPSEDQPTAFSYRDYYRDQKVSIVQITQWAADSTWSSFHESATFKPLRDKYRLNHFTTSEWVWLINRLLFHPTEWLTNQLQPHRLLMGGTIGYSESLSLKDPQQQLDSTVITTWYRIGVHLDVPAAIYPDEEERIKKGKEMISCLLPYIQRLCEIQKEKNNKLCHIFVSSTTPFLHNHFQSQFINKKKSFMTLHTIDEQYPFIDLDQPLIDVASSKKSLFESDDHTLKVAYARSVMDWLILSRMDYLLGPEDNELFKTAAWVAQVQTELVSNSHTCQIDLLRDW